MFNIFKFVYTGLEGRTENIIIIINNIIFKKKKLLFDSRLVNTPLH